MCVPLSGGVPSSTSERAAEISYKSLANLDQVWDSLIDQHQLLLTKEIG